MIQDSGFKNQTSQELLLTLRDKDIIPPDFVHEPGVWQAMDRTAVRILVEDFEGNIALCGPRHQLLPGGGVDEGESLEVAAIRECREEIGCKVEILEEIGTAEEYRDHGNRKQITHCFVAKIVGEKGIPSSIQEDEIGMKVYWYPPEKALSILEKQIKNIPFESYNACFNVRVGYAFLKKFLD